MLVNAGHRLAHALAHLSDAHGVLQVPELRPTGIPESIREAVDRLTVGADLGAPVLSECWGEPGLSPAERLFAWNTVEVLDFLCGDPDAPVGAIPGRAHADLQARFVASIDPSEIVPAISRHLDAGGFSDVSVTERGHMAATRMDPGHPWAVWVRDSVSATTGQDTMVIPNLAGTIPNESFAEVLGMPTIWLPHSYPGCAQHAPDEHALASLSRQAMEIMAGLYWDLGHGEIPVER